MNDIIDTLMQAMKNLDAKQELQALWSDRAKWEQMFAKQLEQTQETLTLLAEYGRLTPIIQRFRQTLLESQHLKTEEQALQYVAKISDEEMLEIYQVSHDLFTQKQFEKSAKIATWLGCLNPVVPAFWRLSGLCYVQMEDFKRALAPFLIAAMMDDTSLENHTAFLECLIKLGLNQEALNYYQFAKQRLTDARQWDALPQLDALVKRL